MEGLQPAAVHLHCRSEAPVVPPPHRVGRRGCHLIMLKLCSCCLYGLVRHRFGRLPRGGGRKQSARSPQAEGGAWPEEGGQRPGHCWPRNSWWVVQVPVTVLPRFSASKHCRPHDGDWGMQEGMPGRRAPMASSRSGEHLAVGAQAPAPAQVGRAAVALPKGCTSFPSLTFTAGSKPLPLCSCPGAAERSLI